MTTTETQFAILNEIKTAHNATAVVEVWTYDVWGNASDGYEVNDRSKVGTFKVKADLIISNVPRRPGASDDFRSFPSDSASFSADLACSFEIPLKTIRSLLGIGRIRIDTDGDDMTTYVNRASDGYPIGEVQIIEWIDDEPDTA